MDRRRFLEVGSATLLSGLISSSGGGQVPETGMDEDERTAYAKYVERSPDFECLKSATGADWIVMERVDSSCTAVKLDFLRLDRPEWRQELILPLGVQSMCPMVSVVGPTRYEASASFSPSSGGAMEVRFDEPTEVRIYRASRGFQEVVIVAR